MYVIILRMELTFIHLPNFVSRWKKYRLSDEDLQALESQLMENPQAGDVVRGSGGLRKMRFAPPSMHKGKSGATRVAYGYIRVAGTVYLFNIFAKKDQENLTSAEVAAARQLMDWATKFHHRKD